MNRQPQGIPSGGQFAGIKHKAPKVELNGQASSEHTLMTWNAVTAVQEHMPDTAAMDNGDDLGLHLRVDYDHCGEDSLRAACPVLATGNPDAKWYVESPDGDFRRDHPDFGHDADPGAVAAWICETKDRYDAGLNADRAALRVQDVLEGSESHNDGDGIYLTVPTSVEDEILASGCPVAANDDPNATWYVESAGGDFHEDHPTFTHDTDPKKVASWIREVKARFESARS